MLRKVSSILFVLQSSLFGLLLGLFYTILSRSTEGQGLAAGGILVFNALVGLTTLALSSVLLVVKMGHKSTTKLNKIIAIINLVGIAAMLILIKHNT